RLEDARVLHVHLPTAEGHHPGAGGDVRGVERRAPERFAHNSVILQRNVSPRFLAAVVSRRAAPLTRRLDGSHDSIALTAIGGGATLTLATCSGPEEDDPHEATRPAQARRRGGGRRLRSRPRP